MKGLDSASIAPGGAWAFTTRSRRGTLVNGLLQLSPRPVTLTGLIEEADLVAWSRDGSFALLYDSKGGQLQRIRLSATTASAEPPLDLSLWGKATALAIDPTGQKIAFGVPGTGLYLLTVGHLPALISSMSQPIAISFDATGVHLFAVDLGQQQILGFDSGGGAFLFASLVQPNGSVLSPTGLGVSGGGRYLLVSDTSRQAVLVYEIASQSLSSIIPLAFPPSRLEALSSSPSFVLNGTDPRQSILILDATQNPSVYFVPAPGDPRQ